MSEIRPKPLSPGHAAYKGYVSHIVLGALRSAHHLMTLEELAMHVMAERNLNTSDPRLYRTIVERVDACMRPYRRRGAMQSHPVRRTECSGG